MESKFTLKSRLKKFGTPLSTIMAVMDRVKEKKRAQRFKTSPFQCVWKQVKEIILMKFNFSLEYDV